MMMSYQDKLYANNFRVIYLFYDSSHDYDTHPYKSAVTEWFLKSANNHTLF